MKIDIISSKLGNKFYFLSNLTLWHFSSKKEFHDYWIKQIGGITNKEKAALCQFKDILNKYKFGNHQKGWKYLGYFFLAHNNKRAWQELSKQTTKDEYNKLKNIFDIFTKKFNKIWKIEKTNIANASKLLATELKEKKYKELEKDLALLFNKKNNKKKIKIFILIRPKQIKGLTGGGHANYGEDLISLEASDLSKKNISRTNKILMVYFHELIHIIYSHPYYNNLIVKFLNKVPKKNFNESRLYKIVKSYYIIIDEALISALLPDGILAEKYFEHNIKKAFLTHFPDGKPDANQKSSLRAWKIYSSYKIKRNLNEYLKAGKKIDMDLLEYLYKIFQEFNNLKKA